MHHQLSYATVKIIADNLAEVVVNNNIMITLEMVEEFEEFVSATFKQPFALIINKINTYNYSFEAMSCMASNENLVAMAVISYDDLMKDPINRVLELRRMDELNIKIFSGLELGWQQGRNWLLEQLAKVES